MKRVDAVKAAKRVLRELRAFEKRCRINPLPDDYPVTLANRWKTCTAGELRVICEQVVKEKS